MRMSDLQKLLDERNVTSLAEIEMVCYEKVDGSSMDL